LVFLQLLETLLSDDAISSAKLLLKDTTHALFKLVFDLVEFFLSSLKSGSLLRFSEPSSMPASAQAPQLVLFGRRKVLRSLAHG